MSKNLVEGFAAEKKDLEKEEEITQSKKEQINQRRTNAMEEEIHIEKSIMLFSLRHLRPARAHRGQWRHGLNLRHTTATKEKGVGQEKREISPAVIELHPQSRKRLHAMPFGLKKAERASQGEGIQQRIRNTPLDHDCPIGLRLPQRPRIATAD